MNNAESFVENSPLKGQLFPIVLSEQKNYVEQKYIFFQNFMSYTHFELKIRQPTDFKYKK
jgi:hypothetical protein